MKARFQSIYDIAALCAKKGLTQAILCPGSRCAPLTLAFTRHPEITCRTITDERSAGFIALGIAQQLASPAILVCTSGTAAYNFAPAVAEAYFSKRPLIIFTADRPTEWVGQQDGQTIYQADLFGKHVKASYQLPQTYDHDDDLWAINRIANEAINLARQEPQGPVHINVPFREPLYPGQDETFEYSPTARVMDDLRTTFELTAEQKAFIKQSLPVYKNILLVAGQLDADLVLHEALMKLLSVHNVPVVGDVISNLHSIGKLVRHADLFLGQCPESVLKALRPDLLISFGNSTISKNLKLFLRKYSPAAHWHIQPAGPVADTFKSITTIFQSSSASFFEFLSTVPHEENFHKQKQDNYDQLWQIEERRVVRSLDEYFSSEQLSELELVNHIIKNVPANSNLHLANSMSVRYANFIGLNSNHRAVQVYSNRGTSGIDGCTSTCVGHSLTNNNATNILITGDLALFYDRNAFWHNYPTPNIRIVLLNNHGGLIFKLIDGPGTTPEADEYFVTRQQLNAKNLCAEFGIEYLKADNVRKIKNLMRDFFEMDGKPKLLELESDVTLNTASFENLKQKIRKSYEF